MSQKKAVLLVFCFMVFFRVLLFAGIQKSAHDFSGVTFVHGGEEICKICHVPHNGRSTAVPLWRGRLGTYGSFTLYGSDTLDAKVDQLSVPSKVCLTCHDGSLASGPLTGCNNCHSFAYPLLADYNLSNDHPISITYDTTLAKNDGALHDPSVTTVASLGTKTIRDGMLYDDRVECGSCHDVHASRGDSATAPHLLLVNNEQDGLCLTCHDK